jgi:hypothetical protein
MAKGGKKSSTAADKMVEGAKRALQKNGIY